MPLFVSGSELLVERTTPIVLLHHGSTRTSRLFLFVAHRPHLGTTHGPDQTLIGCSRRGRPNKWNAPASFNVPCASASTTSNVIHMLQSAYRSNNGRLVLERRFQAAIIVSSASKNEKG